VGSFKQSVLSDIGAVFLNLGEFAEMHAVEGRDIPVVIDEDKLLERQVNLLGDAESSVLFYAAVDALPPRKTPGSVLNFDGREYTVDSWTVSQGLATVALGEPRPV
jgi:hypothetical protein